MGRLGVNMNINKLFNTWIGRNFKGLSAHTLFQFLCMGMRGYEDYYSNMVYVDLFHVFIGKATEEERASFDAVSALVEECAWL